MSQTSPSFPEKMSNPVPAEPNRRKLTVLTVEERLQIIDLHEAGWKIGEIAKDCKVPQSTVSTVVKNKQKWLEKSQNRQLRRSRPVGSTQLEKSMEIFVQQARDSGVTLTGSMIREKAKQFAEQFGVSGFKGSAGWLTKFVKRQRISFRKPPERESVVLETELYTIPELIRGYAPRDVLVASESGLYFKCMPSGTYVYQEEPCQDGQYSEQRITILCAANMEGSEKLPLLLIGQTRKSDCLESIKSLPVSYESNSKAWMTAGIFEKWIIGLDRRLEKEHRQVVMFVQNCPAHPKYLQNKLKCINLQFFPSNASSDLHPLDLVIKTLKYHYRYSLIRRRLDEIDQGMETSEISVLDAINGLSRSWVTDLKPVTIANCFRKAGFVFPDEDPLESIETLEDVPTTISDEEMARLAEGVTFLEYCNVDDGLVTSGLLSDSDIIECVGQPAEADEDEDVEDSKRPIDGSVVRSNLEALGSILAATDNVPAEVFAHFFALEKFLKQSYK